MVQGKDVKVMEHSFEEATVKPMDIDNIFEKIGQFGLIQKFFVFLLCLFQVQKSNQTLIMTFIGNSPDWRCVLNNNTECNMSDIFTATDKRRCHMDRKSWEYTKSKSFSIVTEVYQSPYFNSNLPNCKSWILTAFSSFHSYFKLNCNLFFV